jgi:hypothetical protein
MKLCLFRLLAAVMLTILFTGCSMNKRPNFGPEKPAILTELNPSITRSPVHRYGCDFSDTTYHAGNDFIPTNLLTLKIFPDSQSVRIEYPVFKVYGELRNISSDTLLVFGILDRPDTHRVEGYTFNGFNAYAYIPAQFRRQSHDEPKAAWITYEAWPLYSHCRSWRKLSVRNYHTLLCPDPSDFHPFMEVDEKLEHRNFLRSKLVLAPGETCRISLVFDFRYVNRGIYRMLSAGYCLPVFEDYEIEVVFNALLIPSEIEEGVFESDKRYHLVNNCDVLSNRVKLHIRR